MEPLSPSKIAELQRQLRAQGKTASISQIKDWWRRQEASSITNQTQVPTTTAGGPLSPRQLRQEATQDDPIPVEGDDAVSDFVGGTLWSLLDTGLFGAPGYIYSEVDQQGYDEMMEDLSDTTAGRIGQGLGGAAGFLMPMGLAARGLSAGARGLARTGLLGKGLKGVSTRALQKKAGQAIVDAQANSLLKSSGKALTRKEANAIIKKSSDDIIGWEKKGIRENVMGGGNAMKMEHSTEFASGIVSSLRTTMPNRLATELNKLGVKFTPQEFAKMSDDIVNILSTKPINSLEGYMANILARTGQRVGLSADAAKTVARVASGMGQEAIAFGITGTIMDGFAYGSGQLKLKHDETFSDRFMHHMAVGGVLGAIKFVPGGRDRKIYEDVAFAFGRQTSKLNKGISKMGLDEAKAFARISKQNDKSLILLDDAGVEITSRQLRKGIGLTQKDLPLLKKSLISHNNKHLKEFRYGTESKGGVLGEIFKDLRNPGQLARMGLGAATMNYGLVKDHQWKHLSPEELAFHVMLGAVMTKGGKPLHPGRTGVTGDRPYMYNSDLQNIVHSARSMGFNMKHIGDIVKTFDGNLATDLYNVGEVNPDAENIITKLIENNVIYDKSSGNVSPDGTGAKTLNRDLLDLIGPLSTIMKSRNLELNPNVTSKEMESALNRISKEPSVLLSTPENTILMGERDIIQKVVLKGSQRSLMAIEKDIFDVTKAGIGVLTGNPEYIGRDGTMIQISLDSKQVENMTTEHQIALEKLLEFKNKFVDLNLINQKEQVIDLKQGVEVKLDSGKLERIKDLIDKLEMDYGKLAYGESMQSPADLMDPSIWNQIESVHMMRNIEEVYDVISGRSHTEMDPDTQKDIDRLVLKIFSSKYNDSKDVIVNDPGKITFTAEGMADAKKTGDLENLTNLKNVLWKILSTNKNLRDQGSPSAEGRYEIDITDMRDLKNKLVENGMPDIDVHGMGGRFTDWIERSVTHGIDMQLRGLARNPYEAAVLERLIQNGIVSIADKGVGGRGTRLQAPVELTVDQVIKANQNITKEGAQEFVNAYQRVINRLGNKVDRIAGHDLQYLDMNRLAAIMGADKILEAKRMDVEILESLNQSKLTRSELEAEFKILESELTHADKLNLEASAINAIKQRMEFNKQLVNQLNQFDAAFLNSIRSGGTIERAASFISLSKNLSIEGTGEKLNDLLKRLSDRELTPKDYETIREKIESLQISIAEKVQNSISNQTSIEQMRESDVSRRVENDLIEGRHDVDNKNYITVDKFLSNANKKTQDLIDLKLVPDQTYDNNMQALHHVYKNTALLGDHAGFVRDMAKIVDKKVEDLSNQDKDNILRIGSMFERKHKIKRLQINLDSRKGTFEDAEISHGFLTDLYNKVFLGDELIFLQGDYFKSGQIKNYRTDFDLTETKAFLADPSFFATRKNGYSEYQKALAEGRKVVDKDGNEYHETLEITNQVVNGDHYIIPIDENINILVGSHQYNKLANAFVKWFDGENKSDYVKTITRKNKQAKKFWEQLKEIKKDIENSKNEDGMYDTVLLKKQRNQISEAEDLNSVLHKIFNVMYSKEIDGDFLQDVYTSSIQARKHIKYKRLAQNLGYSRNSKAKREIVRELYGNDPNFQKEMKYVDKETIPTLVIADNVNSKTGEIINGLITDNRSQSESMLRKMKDSMSKEAYENMVEILKEGNSINAESANGASIVRREFLNYLLLQEGQRGIIGSSAGQKPVGLTSFTDPNTGDIHVFYNKTHYFYSKEMEPFFAANKNIDVIAFSSGVKKAKIIDPKTGVNKFMPYGLDANGNLSKTRKIPTIDENISLEQWINSIKVGEGDASVFNVDINQTLGGTNYGSPHEAKILKQFTNWGSESLNREIYNWARADAAERFATMSIELYDPMNIDRAVLEAQSYMIGKNNKDSFVSTEGENMSIANLWIEAAGVPFSAASKNLYDQLIMNRHIKDAGVLDGVTDGGGMAILRPNLANDLKIPIFQKIDGKNKQIQLGEMKVGAGYMDRDIHFSGDYGIVQPKDSKIRERSSYKNASTLTIAIETGGRDILYDLKKKEIYDPLGQISNVKGLSKDIQKELNKLHKAITSGTIVKYRDLHNRLRNDMWMVAMSMPAPRVGPFDAMSQKIKDIIPFEDGGIVELNSYDVTMRAQRDYDTDKLPFYMDTPFGTMKEFMKLSGEILEPLPLLDTDKFVPDFDPYDLNSTMKYTSTLKKFDKFRGSVIKMHRKMSYAEVLFEKLDGIPLPGGGVLRYNNSIAAKQRLSNDSQRVLDIYDGFARYLEDPVQWEFDTLFGNSQSKTNKSDVTKEQPFFTIVTKDSKGVEVQTSIGDTHKGAQIMIKKLINDYGRLLELESNVYEGGQAKSPRYQEYVTRYKDFKQEYSKDRINYNFYEYLKKSGYKEQADAIFFPNGTNKDMVSVMDGISSRVLSNPTAFLMTLESMAKKDYTEVKEIVRPSGDYFNKGVDMLLGRQRGAALELFKLTGELSDGDAVKKDNLINELWKSFRRFEKQEEQMVQLNNIEEQIRNKEYALTREDYKQDEMRDNAYIDKVKEDLFILNGAKDALIDKMSLEFDAKTGVGMGGQKIIGKTQGKEITAYDSPIVVRDSRTGMFKYKKRNETFTLGKNEVAIKDPVILKPVVEHELMDGIAFASTAGGYYAHVNEKDLPEFQRIVSKTRGEIKNAMRKTMQERGYRDWEKYNAEVDNIIGQGLHRIKELAMVDAPLDYSQFSDSFIGNMPKGKETYGLDFLMAMLVPSYSKNTNEFYYSPKTGAFLPAVQAPSKAVINSIFKSLDAYKVVPNHKEFVQDFAKMHSAFYQAHIGGKGFNAALQRMSESTLEGTLLAHTINKAYNNPFLTKRDYKDMKEFAEYGEGVGSEFAELFRQVVQDGAITDPLTMMRLKDQIISQYGVDAYHGLIKQSRGKLIFDGISTKQFSNTQGEGQLIGEILSDRRSLKNRVIFGRKKSKKGDNVQDMFNKVIDYSNFNEKGECK